MPLFNFLPFVCFSRACAVVILSSLVFFGDLHNTHLQKVAHWGTPFTKSFTDKVRLSFMPTATAQTTLSQKNYDGSDIELDYPLVKAKQIVKTKQSQLQVLKTQLLEAQNKFKRIDRLFDDWSEDRRQLYSMICPPTFILPVMATLMWTTPGLKIGVPIMACAIIASTAVSSYIVSKRDYRNPYLSDFKKIYHRKADLQDEVKTLENELNEYEKSFELMHKDIQLVDDDSQRHTSRSDVIERRYIYGYSLAHVAVLLNRPDLVTGMIGGPNWDFTVQDDYGRTPFDLALTMGTPSMAAAFAQTTYRNLNGSGPIQLNNMVPPVVMLQKIEAQLISIFMLVRDFIAYQTNGPDKSSFIARQIESQYPQKVKSESEKRKLNEMHSDLVATTETKARHLKPLIEEKYSDIFTLANDGDMDKSQHGATALHIALLASNFEAARFLLEKNLSLYATMGSYDPNSMGQDKSIKQQSGYDILKRKVKSRTEFAEAYISNLKFMQNTQPAAHADATGQVHTTLLLPTNEATNTQAAQPIITSIQKLIPQLQKAFDQIPTCESLLKLSPYHSYRST